MTEERKSKPQHQVHFGTLLAPHLLISQILWPNMAEVSQMPEPGVRSNLDHDETAL